MYGLFVTCDQNVKEYYWLHNLLMISLFYMYIVMYKENVQIIYSLFKIDCFIMWVINVSETGLSLLNLCFTLYELSNEIK